MTDVSVNPPITATARRVFRVTIYRKAVRGYQCWEPCATLAREFTDDQSAADFCHWLNTTGDPCIWYAAEEVVR